jgi:hypothetical protein
LFMFVAAFFLCGRGRSPPPRLRLAAKQVNFAFFSPPPA